MRKKARLDDNHKEIVNELLAFGASVQSLASVGSGCPDILVGWKGRNFLFEIKNPEQKPSKQILTDDEEKFHSLWQGWVCVITSSGQAISAMTMPDWESYQKGVNDEKKFQKAWG